jgi:hypothetical protein
MGANGPCTARARASFLAVAVLTGAQLFIGAPARANPGAGEFAFHGTASLPTFPCLTACGGSFDGRVDGNLSGVDGTNEWSISSVEGQATASFTYRDNGVNCTVGEADGQVIMRPTLANSVIGYYGAGPAPHPIVDGTLTAQFHWTRAGTVAHIELFDLTLTITVDPTGPTGAFSRTVISGGRGVAEAAFAPHFTTDIPDCIGFMHTIPLTADVVGSGAVEGAI